MAVSKDVLISADGTADKKFNFKSFVFVVLRQYTSKFVFCASAWTI